MPLFFCFDHHSKFIYKLWAAFYPYEYLLIFISSSLSKVLFYYPFFFSLLDQLVKSWSADS